MSLFKPRRLFKPTSRGEFAVALPPEAAQWVVGLADQLDQILEDDNDDLRRLFPTAYPEDPELDAGYQILGRGELVDQRKESIAVMRETATAAVLTEDQLMAWMKIVNDIRLVLGTRLDVGEDDDDFPIDDFDPANPDPELESRLVYHELGMLLSEIVDAMTYTLPEPIDDE